MQPLQAQLMSFLITVLAGMAAGLLYDLYILLRKTIRPKRWVTDLGDLLFWLLAIGTVYGILLVFNWGEVRLYVFIGLVVGAVLYYNLFSKLFVTLITKFTQVLVAFVTYLWMVITFPFRLVQRVILIPLGLIGLVLGKITKMIKKVAWFLVGRHYYVFRRNLRAALRKKRQAFNLWRKRKPKQ